MYYFDDKLSNSKAPPPFENFSSKASEVAKLSLWAVFGSSLRFARLGCCDVTDK
jgi:hypothetical protein